MNVELKFIFEQIRTGGDRNFGYLVGDRESGEAVLIDPSYAPESVIDRAKAQGLTVRLILNTHGHSDHTNGNDRAKKLTRAPVGAHPAVPFQPDVPLEDNQVLTVGSSKIRVLHVPGHTRDHVAFYLPEERVAVTGDLLFVGKIGGTSTDEAAREEHESLQRLLAELPDDATIWPGHDYGCRPSSTIRLEKRTNPFLLASGIEEFLRLKREWAGFKARHGLR